MTTEDAPSAGPQAGVVPPGQPVAALVAEKASDLRAIRIIVSVTMGITLVLAAGYLAAVVLSDGAILLRPSEVCLLYTSPSPRDNRTSRMPSSA